MEEEYQKLHDEFRERIIKAQMNYLRRHPNDPLTRYVKVTDSAIIIINARLKDCGIVGGSIRDTLEKYLDRLNQE